MNQRTHLLHIITGDGKGKTTAAMGQAVRMLGHGKKVYIAQFMKDGTSGELSVLRGLPGVFVSKGARMQGYLNSRTAQQMEATRLAHEEALKDIIKEIEEQQPALTILDELNVALFMRLVSLDSALELIDTALHSGDVVVTGRHASHQLMDKAAYVSKIEAVKHPFNEGQPAREGIEY